MGAWDTVSRGETAGDALDGQNSVAWNGPGDPLSNAANRGPAIDSDRLGRPAARLPPRSRVWSGRHAKWTTWEKPAAVSRPRSRRWGWTLTPHNNPGVTRANRVGGSSQ